MPRPHRSLLRHPGNPGARLARAAFPSFRTHLLVPLLACIFNLWLVAPAPAQLRGQFNAEDTASLRGAPREFPAPGSRAEAQPTTQASPVTPAPAPFASAFPYPWVGLAALLAGSWILATAGGKRKPDLRHPK